MPESPFRIAVIGGSLASMATAGRLARLGHEIILFEATDQLGGLRRSVGLGPVIDFPAPWRDLFFKTGRTLDATLATRGLSMVPAPATRHLLRDGTVLDLPTERGAQFHALTAVFDEATAVAHRDLLDDLDQVWQTVRTHGMEREVPVTFHRSLARQLLSRLTITDLSGRLPDPLSDLVTQVAWQAGLDPATTPAHFASRLARDRTFGHWVIVDDATGQRHDPTVLFDLLSYRLAERGVEVRTGTSVTRITNTTVCSAVGTEPFDAVVLGLSAAAISRIVDRPHRLRPVRRATQLQAALSPHRTDHSSSDHLTHIDHSTGTICWPGHCWDWNTASYSPSFGPRWHGPKTWEYLLTPRLRPGLYAVGATTAAGADPAGLLLSAALAADLCHEELTGEDVRPTNRTPPPRRRQAKPSRLSGLTSARKATDPA